MSGVSAEQIIIEVGKSSELVAAFRMVEEAGSEGEPKFSPQVCRDLAKAIACRNYSKAVLELCHLVRIADALGGGAGYEMFFWGLDAARSSGFRAQAIEGVRLMGGRIAGLNLTESGVEAVYPDGAFNVTFGRMPFLSALMEFLLSSVGYGEIDGVLRDCLGPGVSAKDISDQANGLSRLIYDYLKDHLPTAQNQRKFRRLIEFMEQKVGEDFGAGSIDDDVVFEFWRNESTMGTADGVDFKTFPAAFKTFVRFRQTLDAAGDYQALSNPHAIGLDREAGEIDPDAVYGMIDTIDEYQNPLLALDEPPADAIKFLNRRETGAINLLFECGDAAFALPLSLMRCEVFGKGQGQITQALRRKAGAAELGKLIADCAPESYTDKARELEGVAAHIDKALLASLHALARNRNSAAVNLVVTLRPQADFTRLRDVLAVDESGEGNVVMLRAASVAERFLEVVEDADQVGTEIAGLMNDARKAFRGISRQGFSDSEADNADIQDGFADGAATLIDIGAQITAFVEFLGRVSLPHPDWEGQFAADKSDFSQQFEMLYGGSR
ncbi:MAG: hypothetical protein ISR44_07020 [Rhodospirillales bacterium]|nr:hypothetical protein [Rhodospirillales bacterium]